MYTLAERLAKRTIHLGRLGIGANNPVRVQSMLNTNPHDLEACQKQIAELSLYGCEAIRLAIPDNLAVQTLKKLCDFTKIPLIADIHFDWRLAIASLEAGAVGLRINPGNIGSEAKVKQILEVAKANNACIRIGVNSGSLEKDLLKLYGPSPDALVASALRYINLFEKANFYETKISLKSSNVLDCIASYRQLAKQCDYPLHIGITEAGNFLRGTVKSAVGLGILLAEGIGDTLRVSLTADPVEEVKVAWEILRSLNLRRHGAEIISCPTCGRTEINILSLVNAVEEHLAKITLDISVAIMGCVVNGPGEARQADIGIAGGRDKGVIFRKGQIIRSVKGQEQILSAFLEELAKLIAEKEKEIDHAL